MNSSKHASEMYFCVFFFAEYCKKCQAEILEKNCWNFRVKFGKISSSISLGFSGFVCCKNQFKWFSGIL